MPRSCFCSSRAWERPSSSAGGGHPLGSRHLPRQHPLRQDAHPRRSANSPRRLPPLVESVSRRCEVRLRRCRLLTSEWEIAGDTGSHEIGGVWGEDRALIGVRSVATMDPDGVK